MPAIQFWKSWIKSYKFFFWLLSLLVILVLGFFWYSYIQNPSPVLTWETYQELQTEEISVRSFQVGMETIPVNADNFLIYESVSGSQLQPNILASYIFFAILIISIVIILTIITTLSRFWFMVGMGIFCLVIISLQLEGLQVFGLINKIPSATIIIMVAALAYYFHAFQKDAGFFLRLLSFSTLLVLQGIFLALFSQVLNPVLTMSVSGYAIGILLTIVFILMIGHEIPAAFINIITQGTRQSKSLRHFLIVNTVYLINLLIAYAIKIGYLDLKIWAIDFFVLFTLSAILSIWGFRQRENQYVSILPADPLGIYFNLALLLVALTTTGYLFATANDTAISVIRDVIIYSHLGYGLIFFAYILANFADMLSKNLQVYKVLYKPTTMPYFTFRLMGLFCCLAFLLFDTNYKSQLNQIYATYYNGYGDLFYSQGDYQVAEGFYNKSVFYRNQNHHAHYALASIQAARFDIQKQRSELVEASNGNSTEFSFMNLSDSYLNSGYNLQSIEVLENAKLKFPKSGIIKNALGLVYSNLKEADSALVFFQEARKDKFAKEMAETNLLAASAKFNISYPADSLLQLIGSKNEGPRANALALANVQNIPIALDLEVGTDTTLSVTKAVLLCNYFINQADKIDTAKLSKAVKLARKPVNDYFKESILVAVSHAYYAQGQVRKAFDLTREVAYRSGRTKYFDLLGTWALEQKNPQIAANYFEIAKNKMQPLALFHEAFANMESDSIANALLLLDSISRDVDTTQAAYAKQMLNILKSNQQQALSFSDIDKYKYCRYKISNSDTTFFWRLNESIQNEELKARAILDLSKKWYTQDEPLIAFEIIQRVKGLKLTDKNVYDQILLLNMMLLSELDEDTFQKQDLDKALPLKGAFKNELRYLHAFQDWKSGKTDEANQTFEFLSTANIHFEEGLVGAANFFSSNSTDLLKSYSIIVSGLLARPNSIKLLKAYVKQAALVGFDDEANESLEKLRLLLPVRAFNTYVAENPDYFDIEK